VPPGSCEPGPALPNADCRTRPALLQITGSKTMRAVSPGWPVLACWHGQGKTRVPV